MITLKTDFLKGAVDPGDLQKIFPEVQKAHAALHEGGGKGAEYTGWLALPSRVPDTLLKELGQMGEEAAQNSDCVISIGIGGSYLGIRATVDFLENAKLPVYYAGNNMSPDYVHRLLQAVKTKRITTVVISKSGTTTEPALAFRIVKKLMAEKYTAAELKRRIICVTDESKGALRQIARKDGFRSYVIPDDVGGRYSVLTPVGLVPLALAGIDVKALVEGARQAQKDYQACDLEKNACYRYAACRNVLYRKAKKIEVFSSFYPNVFYVTEWLKQLFGESEGKERKGLFPASLTLSADLHSMGQLMQEGERNMFETFIDIGRPQCSVTIPSDPQDIDGFNYVAGKDLEFVNKKAYEATAEAHYEGGVPNMTIGVPKVDAYDLGALYYFFEKACGISGYLLGVNPFDQPGVEAYKKKMFALLKGKS